MIGPLSGNFGEPLQGGHMCSRAGCGAAALWAILWRNPKIHPADRRKTWLACEEHRDFLHDFLSARSFPLEVLPIGELDAARQVPDD